MAWIEQKKKQFIRWYYGEFVYKPDAEIIMFGIFRPQGAQRLTRVMDWLRGNWKWLALALVVVLVLLVMAD